MSETLEDSQGGPEREEAVVVVVVGGAGMSEWRESRSGIWNL